MKKRLLGVLLAVVALLAAVYYFIPATPAVAYNTFIKANQNTIYRCLTDPALVRKWWPQSGDAPSTADSHILRNNAFRFFIAPNAFNVVNVRIETGEAPVQSFISIFSANRDSTAVVWKAELAPSGPFGKMQTYIQARKLEKSMAGILAQLQAFTQNEKNVYGLSITRQEVVDTLLVVTKLRDTLRPTVETYYGLIKKLRTYIAGQGAQETNYPMMHIFEPDSAHYETMVAIPVNKALPDKGAIKAKRMIPGSILVAEVTGGMSSVNEGFRQLEHYLNEHRMRSPALPFQSLVTDRLAERDTSKWITKLYYPVL